MSRKPSVVSSAVLAPVRSRMVLIATVEPCRNSPAERKSLPAFSTPLPMPSTRRWGVDSVLPKVSAPVRSSNTAMSVKVPPMSAARRIWGREELLRRVISSLSFRGADEVREPEIHIHQAGNHCNGTLEKEGLDPGFAPSARPGMTKTSLRRLDHLDGDNRRLAGI